jgi:glycosyltransferase involved in cell wall biosynthesis
LSDITWKVVHLSTGHQGGSGLAARRLNSALNEYGFQSTFGALENPTYILGNNEFAISRKLWQRLLSGLLVRFEGLLSNKVLFSLISLNVYKLDQINKLGNPENTILHFHNWHNLVSQKEILRLGSRGYPVVLTMHDERFFTGGCHYAFECQKFKTGCKVCPELPTVIDRLPAKNISSSKKLLHKSNSQIVFIAPSKWLRDEGLASLLLKDSKVVFIPNTLGITTLPENLRKISSGESQSLLKIGIASMDKSSYIKGGDITSEIEAGIAANNLKIEMIYLSQIKNQENSKSEFWDQIDYLLVASRAENSPNVIHEAKYFGVPVIASDIGGISELLHEGYDIGIPGNEINSGKILELLTGLRDRKQTVSDSAMQESFSKYVGTSIESHVDLYQLILKNKIKEIKN